MSVADKLCEVRNDGGMMDETSYDIEEEKVGIVPLCVVPVELSNMCARALFLLLMMQ